MKRNYGIDLLRILSMFLVVVLHVIAQGGVLLHTEPGSLKYWAVWALEIVSLCAVNCFALISGYTMSQAQNRISRIFKLWLHTIFYTVLAVILFLCFMPEVVGKKTILQALLPITSGRYWYISTYCGVLILSPLLNAAIKHTEKRTFGMTLLVAFMMLCVIPLVFLKNPFKLDNGYSMLWLCLLYLAGGYIRKYDIVNKVKTSHAWMTVLGMLAITFLTKFVIEQCLTELSFLQGHKDALNPYTSPTMVLLAIGLLILCGKSKPKGKAITVIRVISPAALGVYLSHTNPLVWKYLLKDAFAGFPNHHCFVMICLILLAAFLIFAAGIVIDLIRIKLFELLKVDKLCALLEEKWTNPRSKR